MRREPEVEYAFSGWEHAHYGVEVPERRWPGNFSPDPDTLLHLTLRRDVRYTFPFCTINGLYRRSLCRRLGPWDTEQTRGQDSLYNIKLLTLRVPYRYVPGIRAWARQHAGGQIKDHLAAPGQLENMRYTMRKIQRALREAGMLGATQRALMGNSYWGLARSAFMSGDGRLGLALLDEGIALAPVSVPWLKLRVTKLAYRLLGTGRGNRLFARLKQFRGRGRE
jgi:hypothetical protein